MNEIAELVDSIFEMRNDAKKLRKKIAEHKLTKDLERLTSSMAEAEENLQKSLEQAGIEGVVGETAQCELKPQYVYDVKDFDKLCQYVLDTGSIDIFGGTPKRAALEERFSDGVKVPGVTRSIERKLSITKR